MIISLFPILDLLKLLGHHINPVKVTTNLLYSSSSVPNASSNWFRTPTICTETILLAIYAQLTPIKYFRADRVITIFASDVYSVVKISIELILINV